MRLTRKRVRGEKSLQVNISKVLRNAANHKEDEQPVRKKEKELWVIRAIANNYVRKKKLAKKDWKLLFITGG